MRLRMILLVGVLGLVEWSAAGQAVGRYTATAVWGISPGLKNPPGIKSQFWYFLDTQLGEIEVCTTGVGLSTCQKATQLAPSGTAVLRFMFIQPNVGYDDLCGGVNAQRQQAVYIIDTTTATVYICGAAMDPTTKKLKSAQCTKIAL